MPENLSSTTNVVFYTSLGSRIRSDSSSEDDDELSLSVSLPLDESHASPSSFAVGTVLTGDGVGGDEYGVGLEGTIATMLSSVSGRGGLVTRFFLPFLTTPESFDPIEDRTLWKKVTF